MILKLKRERERNSRLTKRSSATVTVLFNAPTDLDCANMFVRKSQRKFAVH